MPWVWFMHTLKQQCFLLSQFVFCFLSYEGRVCVCVGENWRIFFEYFFFLVRKANPSWMKARDQTRWRLAWIQEKGINKESGERAGVWKRLLSLLVGESQIRSQPPMFGHRRRCPKEKTLKRPTFAGVVFSKSGGFLVNQTSVGVNVVLSVHACCCLSPCRWQAWPRQRYVSLPSG